MIELRQLREKDAILMLEWMHDRDIQKSFQKNMLSITKEQAIQFCKNSNIPKEITNGCDIHFAIVNDSDEYLGTISLKKIDILNRMAEYAIVTRKCVHGMGVATEATRLLLRRGFFDYKLHKIYLSVLKENKQAIHFYEKCGFIHEGEAREHILIGGEYKTCEWYSMLNNEFNEQNFRVEE